MKIICATSMPFAREAFSRLGNVTILPPSEITPACVRDADALAVRSTLRVNQKLLEGSRVRFVGTATIGTDHFDIPWLEQAGIHWRSAAGCNANSVAEYVTAALLRLAARHNFTLAGKTMAVIGVGNVGRLVVNKMNALGLRVLQNDPPRRDAENNPVFQPLETVLREADIVTMHVPLTADGPYPTRHMANIDFFNMLKPGAIFINAARGGVQDSDALLSAMDSGRVAHAILDTWEGEPAFRPDVLARAAFGTPHIAGYSYEGKVMGTVMVYRELCRFLNVKPDWDYEALLPPPAIPEIQISPTQNDLPMERLLDEVVRQLYDIERDDKALRQIAGLDNQARGRAFEELRQKYPIRREFQFTRITGTKLSPKLQQVFSLLGFRCNG
ncbi:MAG: 4-phosphoerythronate dehydrogenase [Kiritimatiellia bacterium]|jgi:erythronate-4-phosphate dehydrogenase